MFSHAWFERNSLIMLIGVLIVVSIGGIIEIAPLFWLESTIEKVQGMRPYTPLELAGRNIYIREGCYNCHSQMVRPFRDEVERYGPYSLAAESMYDHPFQWGSKRTGPDLARVGGKYYDDWHREHLVAPRALVPESVMPGYPFLAETTVNLKRLVGDLRANRAVGVPYTDEMIQNAALDARAQTDPDSDDAAVLTRRYGKVQIRDFDGQPGAPTEMDALIAYLQMLGTLVDFSAFKADENRR
jgi:cytochrome c oxidase cbb3-type subunit 2